MRGDVMLWGLWYWQAYSIIGVNLGDGDVDYYKYEPMAALLDWWEIIKKDKHGEHCHDQRIFSPFVLYVNGMLGREE